MTGRDKSRMSRDITKSGPEKSTVSRADMDDAGQRLKGSAVRLGAQPIIFEMVLEMVGYWDEEFVRD